MPTQLEKLEAHASHMFDAFIKLRQRYSIFEPLLFDKTVVTTLGSGKRAVGFSILKDSLYGANADPQQVLEPLFERYPQCSILDWSRG